MKRLSPYLLTIALLACFCAQSLARHPTTNTPRVHPCEVREYAGWQFVGLPMRERWHDRGDRLTFDGYELLGGWEYHFDTTGFNAPHFYRGGEEFSLEDVRIMGGLPW